MDEERIIKMARLAMYEQDPKTAKDTEIVKYHRRDYVALGIVGNIFLMTVFFAIVLGVYVIRHLSDFMDSLSVAMVKPMLFNALLVYGIILALSCILVFVIRQIRYNHALARARIYYKQLKGLLKEVDPEEKRDGEGKAYSNGKRNRRVMR